MKSLVLTCPMSVSFKHNYHGFDATSTIGLTIGEEISNVMYKQDNSTQKIFGYGTIFIGDSLHEVYWNIGAEQCECTDSIISIINSFMDDASIDTYYIVYLDKKYINGYINDMRSNVLYTFGDDILYHGISKSRDDIQRRWAVTIKDTYPLLHTDCNGTLLITDTPVIIITKK